MHLSNVIYSIVLVLLGAWGGNYYARKRSTTERKRTFVAFVCQWRKEIDNFNTPVSGCIDHWKPFDAKIAEFDGKAFTVSRDFRGANHDGKNFAALANNISTLKRGAQKPVMLATIDELLNFCRSK